MTKHLLDEATALEQRAADLRRQAKMEEDQAAEASKLEVRIRRALALPRRVNGMHPAAFDDTRMSTEDLDAADRARPPSITLCQTDAMKLADVAASLRRVLRDANNTSPRVTDRESAIVVVRENVMAAALATLDSIWK